MKNIISFTLFPVGTTKDPDRKMSELPFALYESLAKILPDGKGKRSIYVSLSSDDVRLIAIRAILKEHGYTEVSSKFKTNGIERPIAITETIQYDELDFGYHEWYEIYPSLAGADYASRDEQGRIRNLGERDYTLTDEENAALLAREEDPRGKIPTRIYDTIASVPPYALVMGKHAAEAALSAGLRISTKPTSVHNIFELTADFVFPPLSPACDFRDPQGQPVSSDMPRLCGHLADGFIQDPLLKYNRTDVMRLLTHGKVVDVAQTRERFGNAEGVSEPLFIISKRFTEWLMTIDGKLRWKPVELI